VIAAGAYVRLDFARARIERIVGDAADAVWTTGARSRVPIDWITRISEAEYRLTESAWRSREAPRARESAQGASEDPSRAEVREALRGEPRRVPPRRRRKLARKTERALHEPLPGARQLRLGEGEA
jgi:hypothetical protein